MGLDYHPHRNNYLVDVSDIFYFSARGGVRQSLRRQEGGGDRVFFIENPTRGGGVDFGEGSGGCLWRIGEFLGGGGGLNIFFRARNVHQDYKRK